MPKKEIKRFNWPIIGHASILSYLQQCLSRETVSHAYLFAGPEHVGKSTVAEYFANSLVCRNLHLADQAVPCGQCECCRQVANKMHPDIYWVQRQVNEESGKLSKNIRIDQIRQLQNSLNLRSFLDSYKIAIINEASALNHDAANCLLKTLEEPTPKTVLILLASNPATLPKTIISRCQTIKFLPVGTREIFDYLVSQKTERKKAKFLATLALGRPGIALDFLHNHDHYLDFQENARQFVSLIKKSDFSERFKIVAEIVAAREIDEVKEILGLWRRILRDLILIKLSAANFASNLALLPDLEAIAGQYRLKDLVTFLQQINLAKKYLEANINAKLTLENLILNF